MQEGEEGAVVGDVAWVAGEEEDVVMDCASVGSGERGGGRKEDGVGGDVGTEEGGGKEGHFSFCWLWYRDGLCEGTRLLNTEELGRGD